MNYGGIDIIMLADGSIQYTFETGTVTIQTPAEIEQQRADYLSQIADIQAQLDAFNQLLADLEAERGQVNQ